MKDFDRIFKIAILVLFSIFLFIYWQSSQNNRYRYFVDDRMVFDTKAGDIYYISSYSGKWKKTSPFKVLPDKKIDFSGLPDKAN